jgi:hypothetical protein
MNFVASDHGKKLIRRTMSSAMNLLLIASFIAAPASIVLLPPLSYAAPVPLGPTWMLKIVANLKGGKLTSDDIKTLRDQSKNSLGKYSYKNLISIGNRIDELAVQQGSAYRLNIWGFGDPDDKTKIAGRVQVVTEATGFTDEYVAGVFENDYRMPMKNTSIDDPMLNVGDSLQTF